MTPAIALLTIGLILLKAGWKNQSVMDVVLGRDSRKSSGNVTTGGASVPAQPVVSLDPPQKAHAGTRVIDGHPVALWIVPVVHFAKNNGWTGLVSSGYRSYADQKRIWDSGVRPAAKPGTSNHERLVFPGGAIDVTDPDGFERALRKYPGPAPLRRDPSINDPVHFSVTGR